MTADRVQLLVVCTANVCRSPLGAAVLRERWAVPLGEIEVSSAGVRAMIGAPVCAVSQGVLGHAQGGAARDLTSELVQAADLVLTMEREQRSAAVRLAPGSQARVFTLREAAALLEGLIERGTRVDDPRELARAMHALRGVVKPPPLPEQRRRWWQRPVPPADPITISDGHGLSDAEHTEALVTVRETTERVADAVLMIIGRTVERSDSTP